MQEIMGLVDEIDPNHNSYYKFELGSFVMFIKVQGYKGFIVSYTFNKVTEEWTSNCMDFPDIQMDAFLEAPKSLLKDIDEKEWYWASHRTSYYRLKEEEDVVGVNPPRDLSWKEEELGEEQIGQ